MNVKVKYFDEALLSLKKIKQGDWIDVRCTGVTFVDTDFLIDDEGGIPELRRDNFKTTGKWKQGVFENKDGFMKNVEFIRYSEGDFMLLNLGFAMELPEGCEAHLSPRGSTFKSYGLIQTNSVGVIDESFCANTDQWFMPVLAMRDGFIIRNEKVGQFRIMSKMDELTFEEVDDLGNEARGGFGSTGTM